MLRFGIASPPPFLCNIGHRCSVYESVNSLSLQSICSPNRFPFTTGVSPPAHCYLNLRGKTPLPQALFLTFGYSLTPTPVFRRPLSHLFPTSSRRHSLFPPHPVPCSPPSNLLFLTFWGSRNSQRTVFSPTSLPSSLGKLPRLNRSLSQESFFYAAPGRTEYLPPPFQPTNDGATEDWASPFDSPFVIPTPSSPPFVAFSRGLNIPARSLSAISCL